MCVCYLKVILTEKANDIFCPSQGKGRSGSAMLLGTAGDNERL